MSLNRFSSTSDVVISAYEATGYGAAMVGKKKNSTEIQMHINAHTYVYMGMSFSSELLYLH